MFNGTAWSAFANLNVKAISAPSCAGDSAGGAICAVLTTTGTNVLAARFNGTSWSTFLNLGGMATSELDCVDLKTSGEVACFARGTNTALFVNSFKGGTWSATNWSGWGSLGGLVSKPSCALVTSGQLVCGVIGVTDSALWVDQFNGTSWSGWTKVGNTGIGAPACATLGTGKVVCTIVGVNNKALSVAGP